MSQRRKVALGMSGGVDSSLAAHLLVEQGYDVTGVYLECWRAPGCRTDEDRQDALKVALSLKIPFHVLDFKTAYKETVVKYFFHEYKNGRTPNPDVMCNKEIKFGLFYDWAMSNGFDAVATGHYAKVEDGQLFIPADTHKDQTYFLYVLTPEQLRHTLFPLGEMLKSDVRAAAEKRGLHVAAKKDSVGICFIGDIDVRAFLRDELGDNPGDVVDVHGTVIGTHKGLWYYTIGQRHGFEVNKRTLIEQSDGTQLERQNIPPFYVVSKKPETNQLVVGFGAETLSSEFQLENPHWMIAPPVNEKILVRIRHTGQLWPARIDRKDESTWIVKLESAIQGLAEGQSAVFYSKEQPSLCYGGGVIQTYLQ